MTTTGHAGQPGGRYEVADGVWVMYRSGRTATDPARLDHGGPDHRDRLDRDRLDRDRLDREELDRDDLAQARSLPPWRAEQFLTGRATLRRLIREVRPDLAGAPIRPDPRGRPRLLGHPDVGVSISHDGGLSAAAVAPGRRVGVDVQLPSGEPSAGMLRRCLREHAARLEELPAPERAREFAWVWTVQESCVKAAGTGLAGRPWAIAVTPGHRHGRWGRYRWISLRDSSPVPLSCAFTSRAVPGAGARAHALPADPEY
ncbi:4'-phosphopantetheinyl transferase family protein [Kitasatospora purpeofusca]|uniref:4'-phosphopantetheinyl transferase family protein n=1 Tax=Kitasatospora purpeofusca TaxID=67352 RepID=UPI002A599BCF|nr:4'-phosphopantetheinyl transferase superfamily protein [Kitasatospora purpeofusca]MDY0816372.1 4'-phosphopantetheinyl transferase superfamily protein [Kitasatospora purpeofusca]